MKALTIKEPWATLIIEKYKEYEFRSWKTTFFDIIFLVMSMKALTIKEPWATLIINGYKKYEFRSWKTNYRGKILIHAGINVEKDMLKRFNNYNPNINPGHIIGEAELVNCIPINDFFNNLLTDINPLVYGNSNHVGKYAWKLVNIRKYEKPIPAKGKLGLWNYDE